MAQFDHERLDASQVAIDFVALATTWWNICLAVGHI